ncbi:MAG: MlaD family protein [Candidatus Binatia bacterium]
MDFLVGIVMFTLIVGLGYFSVQQGQVEFFSPQDYSVYAEFSSIGGLQEGAPVEVAGVTVGHVGAIGLVKKRARITMDLRHDISLHEDARVAIKSKGLIGERYVALSPGRSGEQIPPGGELHKTEPPVDLVEVLTQLFLNTSNSHNNVW